MESTTKELRDEIDTLRHLNTDLQATVYEYVGALSVEVDLTQHNLALGAAACRTHIPHSSPITATNHSEWPPCLQAATEYGG